MVEFTLEQGSTFATMTIVALVSCALAGVFYYRTFGMLPGYQWRTLLGLRIVAILIVVLLLFRPVFSYHKDLEHKPACAFLLDASSSMSIADDPSGVTRFNQARTQIEKWWERLNDDFDLHMITFAEQAQVVDGPKAAANLAPEGKATSLSRALEKAQAQFPKRRDLEAVILLSDGVHNLGRNPLEQASRLGMVVHTVGVGASLRSVVSYRDLQMTGMECPERLLLNNMVKIKAAVEGIGLTGRVVTVTLEEDEKQVADQELTIDDVEGAQEVVFDFRPTNKGRHTYTVKVAPQADEKIVENNQRSTVAVVVEPGIRVLYLEGTTRDEYGAIVEQFLAKDPDLEFLALRQTRPNVFVRRTNIADLQVTTIPTDAETINKFDVFIIGDLDSTYLKPNVQQLIIARAKQNGGLVMLGGGHSLGPGGYEGTPIGDALPVRLGGRDAGQVSDNFLPTLTPDGANHPIFANIAEYFPTQQQPKPKSGDLPPLPGCTRLGAAKPATTVLALHPAEGGMPVLAVQPLEKGRTAVFAGDKTVNWHKVSRFLDQQSPFTRFWGQLVRWLAGRTTAVETGAGVVAETDKAHYEPEEPVKIAAVVRNQDGQGAADAQVTANVVAPSGRPDQITMKAVAGPAGHYGGDFVPPLAGQYKIVVEAKVGGQVIQSDKLLIDVGRPNLEFEKLDLDEKLLSQIAADAHGRYLHLTAADHLVEQLDRSARKKREYYTKELYFPPLFWTLFVAVISIEWVLRKRFQLR